MSNKEIQELVKEAKHQGWTVELTKSVHYKWISPLGAFVFTASTPSDNRAIKNIKRELRAKGMVFVDKKNKR